MENPKDNKITVHIDSDLRDLIPQYLKNRQNDIQNILAALENGDYRIISGIGHSMKGSGGGYGFDIISQLGGDLELSADKKSADRIRKSIDALASYLNRIEIIYV